MMATLAMFSRTVDVQLQYTFGIVEYAHFPRSKNKLGHHNRGRGMKTAIE